MKNKRTGALLGACLSFLLCLILAEPAEAASVALTFDDGPSGKQTEQLLDILEEAEVPATFFLCGYRLEQYGADAERLGAPQYELGIHGYSHDNMSKMSCQKLRDELEETCALIMEKTGKTPTLLRPPGGLSCSCVLEEAKKEGYPVILWSVDPEDWRQGKAAAAIRKTVVSQAEDGDIILLHDLQKATLTALPGILQDLKAKGFTFRTVSELAEEKGISLESGGSYCRIGDNS